MHKVEEKESKEDGDVPYVRWTRDVSQFRRFISEYRKITGYKLGGSKAVTKYFDATLKLVMSIDKTDAIESMPHRITLFNFKIGNPITSHGCICRFHGDISEPEYLLIYREVSFEYIDFISGNYRNSSLYFLFQGLSPKEREKILSSSFDELWHELYHRDADGNAYQYAASRFKIIQPFLAQLLPILTYDINSRCFWSFPKGRVNYIDEITESPIKCALREFKEETGGLELDLDCLVRSNPIIERYLGSNSKNYQTNYFIFNLKQKLQLKDPSEAVLSECTEVRWMTLSQCKENLIEPRYKILQMIEDSQMEYTELNPFWNLADSSYDMFYS